MSKEKIATFAKNSRRYVGFIVIIVTAFAFGWYLKTNPNALEPLGAVPLFILPILLLLYAFFLATNFLITAFTITISKRSYPLKDSFMLTIYSTLVNFFGPLQSGPGFRAVYLKKKIGLSIKDYTLATMLYYCAFLAISLVMMFGIGYPYITIMILVILSVLGLWFLQNQGLSSVLKNFIIIGVVTLAQLLIIAFIYYIELRAIGYSPSISSTLTYTGSANLALFVAFTPGAIGIRESFIYFSQSLHNIPTEYIVSASLLDRAVYVVFLALLFAASTSLHIGRRFRPRPLP